MTEINLSVRRDVPIWARPGERLKQALETVNDLQQALKPHLLEVLFFVDWLFHNPVTVQQGHDVQVHIRKVGHQGQGAVAARTDAHGMARPVEPKSASRTSQCRAAQPDLLSFFLSRRSYASSIEKNCHLQRCATSGVVRRQWNVAETGKPATSDGHSKP